MICSFLSVLQAIFCFLTLIYIHTVFARHPVQCLENMKDSWPRDGILRVEILSGGGGSYSLQQSYEKERRLQMRNRQQQQQQAEGDMSMLYAAFSSEG